MTVLPDMDQEAFDRRDDAIDAHERHLAALDNLADQIDRSMASAAAAAALLNQIAVAR